MAAEEFLRARLDTMIDMRNPMGALVRQMPSPEIEAALAPALAHKNRKGCAFNGGDFFGMTAQLAGACKNNAGRPRFPMRLMVALLYLKHALDLSDEQLLQRWSESVVWQFFNGMDDYLHKLTSDATQIGRFRRVLDGAPVEQLLKITIETAVAIKAAKPTEFERVFLDSTECIGKGEASKPYGFGVKVSLAAMHKQGLKVGALSFAGKPDDGHPLAGQLEQTNTLLQEIGNRLTSAIVDLGYQGVGADCAPAQVIHRGNYKTLTATGCIGLKRRQAIEPAIGHARADHRMDRFWLQGIEGDALYAVLCAAGFNIRPLLRAIARHPAKAVALAFNLLALYAVLMLLAATRVISATTSAELRSLAGWQFCTHVAIRPGWPSRTYRKAISQVRLKKVGYVFLKSAQNKAATLATL
jgi:hypothetical protein